MEIKKIDFPKSNGHYLKTFFSKEEKGCLMECGTVFLKKGQVLPFKTLDFHEVSFLISGKLKVTVKNGDEKLMEAGDLIYLNKTEIRKTETLKDSKILFFLYNDI